MSIKFLNYEKEYVKIKITFSSLLRFLVFLDKKWFLALMCFLSYGTNSVSSALNSRPSSVNISVFSISTLVF